MAGKCFPFFILRKTLSFSLLTKHALFKIQIPNSLSLPNRLRRTIEASLSFLPDNYFSSNVFIYLMFSSFLFLICSYNNGINLVILIYLVNFTATHAPMLCVNPNPWEGNLFNHNKPKP
jgi:hypothetical protein